MQINETIIQVRFVEVDSMEIAHHSYYYQWFEVGRFNLMKEFFKTQGELVAFSEYKVPVTKSQCRYLSPARFDQVLLLKTYIQKAAYAKLVFFYELENDQHIRLAVAKTEHVLLDRQRKVCINWPEGLKATLKRAFQEHPECFSGGEQYERYL